MRTAVRSAVAPWRSARAADGGAGYQTRMNAVLRAFKEAAG